ncbi:MAG: urea carboxylase-associated family protein [Rhodospirillales bacterium]|nr:urea carboxylase-associated family protein [Rhodospirillales bacterium]
MFPPASEIVPAGHGRAFRLAAGEALALVNPLGTQVVDTWAFAFTPAFEFLSMEHTRSVLSTIFIRRGMTLVSDRRRPMLLLAEDSSPGVHDTLLPACTPAVYRELGAPPDHRSCAANLHEALAAAGHAVPFTPAPFNLFMNVPLAPDGSLDRRPPVAAPGARVVLRAAMDLLIVFSACPQDITPINGEARRPSDVLVQRLGQG